MSKPKKALWAKCKPCGGTGLFDGDMCHACKKLGKVLKKEKPLTGYALLRSVCTKEERKELGRVRRDKTVDWNTTYADQSTPSTVLALLFNWHDTKQGHEYWKGVKSRLLYLEASKGW